MTSRVMGSRPPRHHPILRSSSTAERCPTAGGANCSRQYSCCRRAWRCTPRTASSPSRQPPCTASRAVSLRAGGCLRWQPAWIPTILKPFRHGRSWSQGAEMLAGRQSCLLQQWKPTLCTAPLTRGGQSTRRRPAMWPAPRSSFSMPQTWGMPQLYRPWGSWRSDAVSCRRPYGCTGLPLAWTPPIPMPGRRGGSWRPTWATSRLPVASLLPATTLRAAPTLLCSAPGLAWRQAVRMWGWRGISLAGCWPPGPPTCRRCLASPCWRPAVDTSGRLLRCTERHSPMTVAMRG
mmetsp:Transcript_24484/g.68093  ORF Transcript_24484/g.68093 Transcript_24484/m.68093 type:complete len:291 (-) Transcript_24484:987-1859(-)